MPEDEVQYDEELSERQVLDVHLSAQAQARVHHSLYHQLTEHKKDKVNLCRDYSKRGVVSRGKKR